MYSAQRVVLFFHVLHVSPFCAQIYVLLSWLRWLILNIWQWLFINVRDVPYQLIDSITERRTEIQIEATNILAAQFDSVRNCYLNMRNNLTVITKLLQKLYYFLRWKFKRWSACTRVIKASSNQRSTQCHLCSNGFICYRHLWTYTARTWGQSQRSS